MSTRRTFIKHGLTAAGAIALTGLMPQEDSMAITAQTQANMQKMFQGQACDLADTDPEFADLFANFAFDEVASQNDLDQKTRFMAILATLLGCQAVEEFEIMLPAALNCGLSPVEAREVVYQATAYLGMGRVRPFLRVFNAVLKAWGIALPLAAQGTTTRENRREKGTQAQVDIFGPGMADFWKSGPEETRHINYWLAANCFGDYYTRNGLDLKQRELVTFCQLAAQGGCEAQLIAHCKGNFAVGNDKTLLIKVVSHCLPYIGYPRSLNALRCINEAAKA